MKLEQRKSQPVRVQIHLKITKPKGVRFTSSFMDEVVTTWAETGEVPDGFKIEPVVWERPSGRKRAAYDEDVIEKAREELVRRILWQSRIRSQPAMGQSKNEG